LPFGNEDYLCLLELLLSAPHAGFPATVTDRVIGIAYGGGDTITNQTISKHFSSLTA